MFPSSRRVTGISGITFVVLAIAAVLLSGESDFGSTDQELGQFFDDSRQVQVIVAMVIAPLAVAALLWFIAGLRELLGGESHSALSSAAALGGGVFAAMFLVGLTVSNAVPITLAFTDRYSFDAQAARLTLSLGVVILTGALAGAAVLIAAASLAGRRSGLVPVWLARSGYVVAVLSLFAVLLFAWPYALVAAWILAMSIVLMRAPGQPEPADVLGQRAGETDVQGGRERPTAPEVGV